jgi:hypothetical protein
MRLPHPFLQVGPLAFLLLLASAARAEERAPPQFEKDILPILEAKCLRCHGAMQRKARLDLRTRTGMVKGGETGPALAPGSPERSEIWIKISADKMPPDGKDPKLTEAEKVVIRSWIESGAKANDKAEASAKVADVQLTDADRDFWSFKQPVRPNVPAVKAKERVRNAVDAFVLAALEKKGLTLSPEADRRMLIRRATFDLTGLPPTPEEVEAFQDDAASDAYERVIDRLLASPAYGERWGRHWLDLAGYADSEGILDADYPRSAAWRYRDYVIRAFNDDKPYDRFLKEQIAGDELIEYWKVRESQKEFAPEQVDALVATGYLRCASDTSRPDFATIKNAPGYYFQTLDDTVRIIASSTLGLTLQCARCHSHKYDPIPQSDYYRVQAVFMSGYRPSQWVPQVERRLFEATAVQEKETAAYNATVDAAIASLKKQEAELRTRFGENLFNDRLAKLPQSIRVDVKVAVNTDPAKRNEVQKYLAGKFENELRPADQAVLAKALSDAYPEFNTKSQELRSAIKGEDSKRRTLPEIRAFYDLPGEVKTHLLRRGDYLNPGPEVEPGTPAMLAAAKAFSWSAPPKEAKTSGRRLAFAEWLTQPEHPLTARVLVNRLWLHHFGEGIVATPDNFGRQGAPPSHPELLDWLATELVARGWSVKAMHRLILTSSAYRQVSRVDPKAAQIDPDNRLLWRQRMRRLEAEPLRDAVLSASGSLNDQAFGPPAPMQRKGDGEVVTPADTSGNRRSVYLQVRRSQPLTLLQVFDQPVMETNCTRRGVSTVSSQALTLLNSDFLTRQADAFAARVLKEKPDDPAGYAVLVAFGRPATETERAKLTAFIEEQSARYKTADAKRKAVADLCHMLLSANEFAYID